jgi:phage terminase large subunit-like protein
VNPVEQYARSVVAGKVPAGKYHRLACERHLSDLKRQKTKSFPYEFSWPHAEKFLRFARLMKHYKGSQFAGKPFDPTPVQVFRLGSVFGWRHVVTGRRRFTVAYNDIPRKHGKSFEGALVLMYATFFEGESGAEGYCIATKEKQARIVFGDMKQLIKSSGLSARLKVNAWNVNSPKLAAKAEPLGSDSDTQDGLNPHVVVCDELHAMKTRSLVDVMESATGARVNPLFYFITTHGDDMVSVWGDYITYAEQILDGVLDDDPSTVSFFAFIAHADEGDDPFVETTWRKANPHWGVSVEPDDFRKQAAKAQRMPTAAKEFKQKRLNMKPDGTSAWLDMAAWKAGQTVGGLELQSFAGRKCWIGLDLASSIDLCALIAFFPPETDGAKAHLLRWVWTPADTLDDRAHRDRAPYRVWADRGYLLTQPGKEISHTPIREALATIKSVVEIVQIGYDPWHAPQLVRSLAEHDGFAETQLIAVPQTYAGVAAASKKLEALVLGCHIDAGDCPVMAWAFSNAVTQSDGKGNIQPTKKRSRGRIDPVTATVTAIANWIRQEPEESIVNAWVI